MQAQQFIGAAKKFATALKEVLGPELHAVAVYGSLVKGAYDPTASDHDLVVVLDSDSATNLRDIAHTMERRRPSRRTGLLILTLEDLDRARDVLPLKLRDISRHHELVLGDEALLAGLTFDEEDLRSDCEHQLRNVKIRLRQLFTRGERNPEILRSNLGASLHAFLPPMAGLIELLGGTEPLTPEAIIAGTAKVLGVSAKPLEALRSWTTDRSRAPSEDELDGILDGYTAILQAATERADQHQPA